ncbi:uncharacterized protein LOC143679233 isoform X3 [Tamandua tetradactyla]|uniref:uncharacterized protein LOC143679233 isoform X3 n=1 Tax=Tamandua tetradactyla TaxID=48850 RepID=UPI0040538473
MDGLALCADAENCITQLLSVASWESFSERKSSFWAELQARYMPPSFVWKGQWSEMRGSSGHPVLGYRRTVTMSQCMESPCGRMEAAHGLLKRQTTGIELGSQACQARILPLSHRLTAFLCFNFSAFAGGAQESVWWSD